MGRSGETFSKKENEKKKIKKKLEKQEKKEERKSGAKDSFDDMIAYVDENGNITSTPPDPRNKREINLEDIQMGAYRPPAVDESADTVRKGVVTFFNESKGYGFIKDTTTQESIFVHINGLIDKIKERDKVTFDTENTPKGPNAIRVKLAV